MTLRWTAAVPVVASALCAMAHPHPILPRASDTSNPNGGTDSKTFIIAGVVVGVLFIGVVVATFRHMAKAKRLAAAGGTTTSGRADAAAILSANPSSANLTTTAGSTTTAAAARPARRTRRPRRTPSQISTKSLPAYNEEPGDEELVLVRRAAEQEEYSQSSVDLNARSTYDSRSSVDVQTPLMQQEHSEDQDDADDDDESRISSRQSRHRVNMSIDSVATGTDDTHGSRNSTSALIAEGTPNEPSIDERGEAPPYMEHVETPSSPMDTYRSVASRIMPSPLRNLFGGGTRSRPQSQVNPSVPMVSLTEPPASSAASRPRADTAATTATIPESGSVPALLLTRSRSPSNSRLTSFGAALSRPLTNNSSNSSFHAPFTHQRNRSGSSLAASMNPSDHPPNAANLTSPSSTSINSALISSPLSHTITRTEFRFPKSGPTADQLKFLSSKESLGKFGVPFGEEAERNAIRPPAFEDATGASGSGSGASSRHGASSSNPENIPPADAAPQRPRPASWWKNLTQPAGAYSAPKTEGDAPSTSTSTEPQAEAEWESFPSSSGDAPSRSLSAAARIAASARQSLSLPGPSNPIPAELPLPLSRNGTVSSSRTSRTSTGTFQTAADTAHSPPSDEEGDGMEDVELATPSTPTMARQHSLAASIHEVAREPVDVPPVPAVPATVSAH